MLPGQTSVATLIRASIVPSSKLDTWIRTLLRAPNGKAPSNRPHRRKGLVLVRRTLPRAAGWRHL